MTEIPEEAQARALRVVAQAAAERAAREAELERAVREAAITAVQTGAQRTRVQKLSGVSPKTFYAWLADAGIAVRPSAKRKQGS